jgi:hypothetical protein
MSLSTQDINLVKRKVFGYLKSGTKGDVFAVQAIDQLFRYLSGHGSNPDLQFVAFSDLTGDTVIADAACKIYAIFMKKQATATDAFAKFVDHASTAAGTTFALCIELNDTNDRVLLIYPRGLAMSAGVTAVSSTTDVGGTDSTAGDGPNGFVVIGS